jgi:hypothetical protein
MALTGFFGFFLFVPLVFLTDYDINFVMIPFVFAAIAVIGLIGCLAYHVNPLYQKGDKIVAEIVEEITKKEIEFNKRKEKYLFQNPEESFQLVKKQLEKMQKPYKITTNALVEYGNEAYNFPFVAIGPNGIVLIHPCNWGGRIVFSNRGGEREIKHEKDTQDPSVQAVYRSEIFKKILRGNTMDVKNIRPVICLTNESAEYYGNPSGYDIVTVDNLLNYLNKEEILGPTKLADVKYILSQYMT